MGKKRTFLYEGTPVDVDDSAVNDFLSKFPKAEPMESFVLGNDTVDVPASDISVVEKFKQQYPDAKPLFGEEQPQEIPTITLDSTEVAEGTAEAPKPPTGPLKPGGGFTIGKTPTLTKQTKDIFVKNFLELPDNLKLDARNSGVFVNTFAKKMNLSPRELRQVANETVKTEVQLKQLKTAYDQNPDDTDTLYKLAELHNNLGQHDLAYEAYAALEGKLKTIGEKEYADRISKEPVYTKPLPLNFVEQMPHANRLKSGNLRPDYVEQRQLPAVAGMAYTQELLGNKAEAQRLKGISESKGYKGQEFSSVGAGEALQPGNDMVYNDQGQMVPVGSPTPESEYLNGIAQAIENFTLFGPANEMTNVGFDKLAKNLPGAFDPYGLPSDKIAKTVGVITGAVETLMGVAGMTTPAGALFAMPLVQAQNIAPEQAKWMMPLGVVLNEYYRQQGEKMPEMMENVTVLADLGLLGFLTHQGVEGAKGLKAEIDLKKVFENLPPEAVEQLAKVGEKRIEMAQGDPKVYGEQMALRLDELKPQVEEIKMQAEAAKPVEPYNPPPHPESLRTVEEGSSIIMNGEEGILERSDDGSWNFTTDKKSTQIPVADKFNPTETLKELGIEVLAEITPEQVARATADAEQVGRVEMNGKEYFVSLDRVGNENPTGDFVLEVKPDGTMINRFDSHPDPTFAKERKLKVINTFLESKGLPKRDKLTSTKLVEETPTQEQPSTLEIKPIENEKANQEGREEGLLDTPPLEQPLAPVAEKPTPNEPVSPAVEVQIEDFGVPKSDVGAVKSLLDNVFAGLKKAGLTAFKTLDEWIGIGKGEAKEQALLKQQEFGGFVTRDGTPVGFKYDVDKVARERFNFSDLKQIGKGSDRSVFDLGDGKVLKVAHSARGLEQNIYEGDYYLKGIVPEVYERGLNYVVVEKVSSPAANKIELYREHIAEEFDKAGFTIGEQGGMLYMENTKTQEAVGPNDLPTPLRKLAKDYGYLIGDSEYKNRTIDYSPVIKKIQQQNTNSVYIDDLLSDLKKFSQKDFDNKNFKLQEVLEKYELSDILSYDVLWGDFIAKRNWGIKDGSPIHLDGGTFGGVKMLTSHKGKTNLSDPEFRKIYEESKALKKQFGDTDKATMYKKAGGEVQAQYHIQSGKNIIEAIKNFNGSKKATVAITHEIMHPTVVAIIDGAKSGVEKGIKHTDTIVSEYNKAKGKKITAQELIEGNDAFKEGETSDTYRAVQEFIADSWEKYHREGGKGFSESFQKVLEQITQAFTDVYKTLKGKELTPELRKMFDEILGKEPEPVKVKEPRVESEIETKVRELKPQLEVTPESIEIEAPDVESEFRKEPSEGNIGNDVDVRFADNVTIGAKYKLIEADDLQASHYTSGARNEKHGISQAQPKERNDLGSKAQQDKIAANPKFELVSEDNAAYSGAPIVNSRGEVIQGNNRSIGLKKHYQGGGTKYKGDLAANAEKYGFTKEQVEGMKNPVLVREITAQDNMAVRLGQFKATDLETGGKTRIDPITTSRKMSSQERGVLARLLVEGDYNSIKDAIRDNQKEIMKVLKKHLSPSEIKSMLKPGEDSFSATGMDDVAQVFSNLLFEGGDAVLPEIWDNLPARTRKNLEKALPEILETAQEKSILPAVQNVMMALHEWANSGIENFGEWKSQVDMFKGVKPDDIFTPFEMALGEKLANAKTQGEAKAIFQEYNELVSGTKETLFEQATEGKSMSDAVKELFNVELNEKDTQLQGERGVKATIPQEKPKTTTKTSKPQATGEGELTPDTPLKITSKEKALKAVDDLESFLLNLPGIKDNVGGERMGAPFSAEEAVKWFTKTLREGLDQGYKIKEAIERAIGKLGEHKTYSAYLDAVGEDVLRSYSLKQYEGQDINRPIETQFGASHASVAEVRKVMGIEDSVPISERVKRDVKTVMEEGKKLASKIDLEELSDQVIYDGRSLNANEQAALVFRETELYNEIKDAENSLSKAVASGKKDAADLAQTRIDIAYKQQTAIMQALDIAGSEMGLAFRMRQVMNKRDYSLVSLEKRWTQASGGAKMPADVRKQFSDMVKDLEAKNKRYEELLEVKDKQLAEQALANIQESMGRSGKPTDKVKAGEKLRRLADRIEAGKISRLGGYKTSTGFDAVYDLSLTAVAETLRATGKLADAIESGIKKIRETDWYKDLTDKNDFETKYREHLNKEYEKTDYDAPSMNEKGDLILDNQMLRDVVESLEVDPKLKQKNPQEFIDKVHEIVKEVFPDIERRKVQDAISGYGKKINSSLDDLQREVNSLKRDLKGISGLEDAKAGKGVLKSGYSPPKPTPMQREQQREIHKELKNHPQDQASLDKKWATALDRTKSALKNSITDLRKRIEDIKAGTATPKTPREKLKLDNEAEMMQEVVDDLEQQLIDLEGKKTLSIEQRIDMAIQGAERTRELYERRTKEIRDTGTYTRDTPVELSSPKLTIARQIRDAAKAVYEATRDASPGEKSIAEQTKAARDLRASEDRVKDLENKIKKNQIGYAAKAQMAAFKTPELIASLAKEKALNEVINTMREEQGLVEAHARDLWKARKQRQIAEIERRIREKDYTKKVKPELELDIEMERIQAEMDRKKFDLDVEIEKEKYRNLSGRDKRYEMWLDIVNAPKSLMASMDFSAPLRQGAILSSRHPLLAAKTFKNMFKHWASEEYATNWHSELVRSDGYIRAKKSNLFISEPMARLVAAEERFSSNIAEKIPVWGRGVKASNRAYSGFLNELRMEVFNQHYEALQRNGFKGKQMQKELDAMAYLINNFTGRGSLGKAEIAAPLANSFFFAPRFVASRFNTLYNSLFGYTIPRAKGGGRLITPRARIEAYKAVGSYITAGMSVIAMAKAAGADVEIDPRSSDFGKIKIGDTRYDIWAGHQQIVVLLSKIAMQASKSPRTGKVTEFGENDNAAYTTLRFLRTKLSPPVGALVSAGMKKNVDGTPFTAQGAAWDMITPLIFSDMKSMYEEEGAVGVLRSAVPATFGVGVNTFEKDAIIKQSNLDKSSEKLMLERKYQPQDYKDDEVYVKGKPYIIPEDIMVKIKEMRAKEAGKLIELHYWKLKKLTPEEYESKVNSYYNEGLKKARNKYLPSGWKNTK